MENRYAHPYARGRCGLATFVLLIFCALTVLSSSALAAQVTLAWDANDPAPDGYRLYQRMEGSAYNYNQPVWTGSATTADIDGLADDAAYYFVVRAYVGSDESGDSNEVSYTTPAVEPAPVNQAPTADAGNDQTVLSGVQVTLNGTNSSDPDGDGLSYAWVQSSGTTVTLATPSSSSTTFTAPTVTSGSVVLVFTLSVNDGAGASDSDQIRITVQAPPAVNQAPTANAGGNQTVPSQALVTLNGSGSSDPDGDSLSYAWVQSSGAAVVLSTVKTASFTFTAPTVTSGSAVLVFTLTVNDGKGGSDTDQCSITVEAPAITNQAPVADAGENQNATAGNTVTLDGSGSSDPEQQTLTYQWRQTLGSTVSIYRSNRARATFTAPAITSQTTLAFELTVTDTQGLASSDTCLVLIEPDAPADSDGDGVEDAQDAFPTDPAEWADNDNDGIGNNADADDDNDGMPDIWETQHGLDPFSNDAGLDADGDGVSNLAEYQAGTDPSTADGNHAPDQPEIILPKEGSIQGVTKVKVEASVFSDPDSGDRHALTQWQILNQDETMVMFNATVDKRHLESFWIPRMILDPNSSYVCKVRYYDNKGNASSWSHSVHFSTQNKTRALSASLLTADEGIDLNGDQVDDSLQSDIITSAETYNGGDLMGVSIENSTNVTQIVALDAFDPDTFEDSAPFDATELPYGMLGYKIRVAKPGQTATVQILFSDTVGSQDQWYQYSSIKGWLETTEGIALLNSGNGIERELTDGGEEDADGVANGFIVEVLGPRSLTSADGGGTGTDSSSNSGSGLFDGNSSSLAGLGSGCFLQSIIQ